MSYVTATLGQWMLVVFVYHLLQCVASIVDSVPHPRDRGRREGGGTGTTGKGTTGTGGEEEEDTRSRWTQDKHDKLTAFLEHLMECRSVPGMSLSVVADDRVLLTSGIGLADIHNNLNVTDDTLFCLASLTKAFTSVLLGILLQKTSYDWDSPLSDILPDETFFSGDYRNRHVTIRDLLLHRTGMPRHDILWYSGKYNRPQLVRTLQCLESVDDFRDEYKYNNLFYLLAGHVAERMGGASWEQLVRDEILTPLGMTRTRFYHHPRGPGDRFATQYCQICNKHRKQLPLDYRVFSPGIESAGPAVSLCSTAADMARWLRFLGGGQTPHAGRPPLSPDVMQEIFTPRVIASLNLRLAKPDLPVTMVHHSYALGWYIGHYRGYRMQSHYGSLPGYFSHITLLPDVNLAVFSAVNGGLQTSPYVINSIVHSYIIDLLMDHQPWIESLPNWRNHVCTFPRKPEDPPNDVTLESLIEAVDTSIEFPRDPVAYVGTYFYRELGDVEVWLTQTYRKASRTLHMSYGRITFTLFPFKTWNTPEHKVDAFKAVADETDWLVAPYDLSFHVVQQEVVEVVIPDLYGGSANAFVKLPANITAEVGACMSIHHQLTNSALALEISWVYTLFSILNVSFVTYKFGMCT